MFIHIAKLSYKAGRLTTMEGVAKSARDLWSGAQCIATGCYHSLLGVLPVFHLVQQNAKIRRQLLQCFLLNGVILCLGILTFDYVFLPMVQRLAGMIYGVVISSPPSESHLLQWLGTVLHYLFTGLWVLPVFWISKPINVIWFQDIASAALYESQKHKKPNPAQKQSANQSISQTISRFLADFLFSILLQLLFLLQAMVVGVIPGVGWLLSVLHMTILYSLYCFEYKWMHDGWQVHKRITFIEARWPYFVGFGFPLYFLTSLSGSLVISASVFAVSFPLFIISATSAKPSQTSLPPLPIFNVVISITNKMASRTSRARGTRVTTHGVHY